MCKCDDMLVLMAVLVAHVARGEVGSIVMPALRGPPDTCLHPSGRPPAGEAPTPTGLWIRKVLLWLSGRASSAD